jgi:predicted  nucleic acid-binding Zn-ribbon protein
MEQIQNKKPEGLLVKCPHCGHIQVTRTQLILAGCSSCGNRYKKLENIYKISKDAKLTDILDNKLKARGGKPNRKKKV